MIRYRSQNSSLNIGKMLSLFKGVTPNKRFIYICKRNAVKFYEELMYKIYCLNVKKSRLLTDIDRSGPLAKQCP